MTGHPHVASFLVALAVYPLLILVSAARQDFRIRRSPPTVRGHVNTAAIIVGVAVLAGVVGQSLAR